MPQPTTNNLEGWELMELKKRFGFFEEQDGSIYVNASPVDISLFISDLRKHDMEELIKLLRELDAIAWHNKVSLTTDEMEQLIKDYYENN
jgi:hypothetical protein